MLRKKWLSFLVAVSMVAAMLPTTAFAEGSTVPVESTTTVVETATGENKPQNTEGDKSEGEKSEEEKSEVETSEEEKSEGDKSEGETSEEEKSEGDKSEGEVSEEEKSEGDKSEGEVSEDEKSEGETNEDKTPAETPVTPAPDTTETTETPAANGIMLMNGGGENSQVVFNVEDLKEAVAKAKDGDTITLAAGNYDIDTLTIGKAVNIVGAGAGETVLTGNLKIAGASDDATINNKTINVSGITMKPTDEANNNWGLYFGNGYNAENDLNDWQINVADCAFEDWEFAICLQGGNVGNATMAGNKLTVTNCTFDNVFCATSVDANVGELDAEGSNFEPSEGFYANQTYSVAYAEDGKDNLYYATVADVKNNDPAVSITVSEQGNFVNGGYAVTVLNADGTVKAYYETVQAAVNAADEGSTVTMLQDAKLDSMLTISTKGLTLDLGGHKIYADASFTEEGTTTNDNHLVDITADNVTITNGTLEAGEKNNHTLNVWNADGVTVSGITLDGSKAGMGGAPLIVGASNVTLKGDIELKTGENSWYGMNVDSRKVSATDTGASLTLENANVTVTGPKTAGIYVENSAGSDVTLNFNGTSAVTGEAEGFVPVQFAVSENGEQSADATLTFGDDFDASKLGIGATVTAADGTTKGYNTFADAIADVQTGDTVNLFQNAELDSMLTINTQGLQLDLNGHTISASNAFTKKGDNNQNHLVDVTADGVTIANGTLEAGSNNNHTLNVWNAQNVTLNGLTLDNTATYGGAPLIVGASDVTLKGSNTFVTGEKSWYGANVDSREVSSLYAGASLTMAEGASAVFEGESPIGIYVENTVNTQNPVVKTVVKVEFEKNTSITSDIPDFVAVVYAPKLDGDGNPTGEVADADIVNPGNAGLITDKDGNYVVKPAPAPQPQQPAGGSSHKHNYTWQHSDDEHWQYCADCGQAISNGPHTLQWKDGYQECTVCGYRVGSSTAAAPAAQASAPAAAAPAAPAAPAAAAIPQTGDASNPMLWVVLLAVSGSALGALVYTKKKREE